MSADYNYPDKKPAKNPDILVDVYGNKPPRAADFGKGISDRRGAQEAQDARRNVPPGSFDHKR